MPVESSCASLLLIMLIFFCILFCDDLPRKSPQLVITLRKEWGTSNYKNDGHFLYAVEKMV